MLTTLKILTENVFTLQKPQHCRAFSTNIQFHYIAQGRRKLYERSHLELDLECVWTCACSEYNYNLKPVLNNIIWCYISPLRRIFSSFISPSPRWFTIFSSTQVSWAMCPWSKLEYKKINSFSLSSNHFDRGCRLQQKHTKWIKWNNGNNIAMAHCTELNEICIQQTNDWN